MTILTTGDWQEPKESCGTENYLRVRAKAPAFFCLTRGDNNINVAEMGVLELPGQLPTAVFRY